MYIYLGMTESLCSTPEINLTLYTIVLVAHSCLIVLQPHGLWLLGSSPGGEYSPGKNTGVGCHFLFQGIFLTQGLNLCF